jgi:transglutaminase-like putative cysteine protease
MKIFSKIITVLVLMLILSCSRNHLINDRQYLTATENAFNKKRQLAARRDSALFSVFKQKLSTEQSEALKFLYAYMPLNDLADYDGRFFLSNADISLKTRKAASWGKSIPDDIFLHYVLPYRINNENLDSFRIKCFDEIINRIKGMDMTAAALEINHWCHEKVAYQAADIRTSAPLSTILSARGRCGEESTFTVAALRTAGIPARQVYTPRWAHTDDNHAWVEIWINGDWYYMGACEPEPVLDRGWFTEPARRAMLIHTKSFGAYYGNENAITRTNNFTDVNNLKKYAPVKKIVVKVTDMNNEPVDDAIVEYQLYNYAEFYPLASVPTQSGFSTFETGLGDLLIWAHKGDEFNFRKISVAEIDTLELKLGQEVAAGSSIDMNLSVPVVLPPLAGPSEKLIEQNSIRIKNENLVRQNYIDSWMKPADAINLAISLKADTTRIRNIISRSMGNYNEIRSFLTTTPDTLLPCAITMLEVLADKDLRDTKAKILADHLVQGDADNKIFANYILNPRIANEMLVPYRKYFQAKLAYELINSEKNDPSLIVKFLEENVSIADDENYYGTPLTPVGVNELRVSDKASRAICFVAICRSMGIPARLEPGRNIPQYLQNNSWNDVYFSDQKKPENTKGFLKLESSDTHPVPEYYTHFTIARFESGRYNTLEYDNNIKVTDFREEIPLPPGHYMLVTGNRLNDSRILSNISFFDLSANEHKTLNITTRKETAEKNIAGKIDLAKFSELSSVRDLSQCCARDNGLVIIWIDPEKEPSKHIFNDLPLLKEELDSWGGKFLFLSDSPFNHMALTGLPANSTFAVDRNMNALKNFVKFNSPVEIVSPVVLVADRDGNIVFVSNGYRIGIGEQILKFIK